MCTKWCYRFGGTVARVARQHARDAPRLRRDRAHSGRRLEIVDEGLCRSGAWYRRAQRKKPGAEAPRGCSCGNKLDHYCLSMIGLHGSLTGSPSSVESARRGASEVHKFVPESRLRLTAHHGLRTAVLTPNYCGPAEVMIVFAAVGQLPPLTTVAGVYVMLVPFRQALPLSV